MKSNQVKEITVSNTERLKNTFWITLLIAVFITSPITIHALDMLQYHAIRDFKEWKQEQKQERIERAEQRERQQARKDREKQERQLKRNRSRSNNDLGSTTLIFTIVASILSVMLILLLIFISWWNAPGETRITAKVGANTDFRYREKGVSRGKALLHPAAEGEWRAHRRGPNGRLMPAGDAKASWETSWFTLKAIFIIAAVISLIWYLL